MRKALESQSLPICQLFMVSYLAPLTLIRRIAYRKKGDRSLFYSFPDEKRDLSPFSTYIYVVLMDSD